MKIDMTSTAWLGSSVDHNSKGRNEEDPRVSLVDLSCVGRGIPAGDWFRRYWLAVGVAGELRDTTRAHGLGKG